MHDFILIDHSLALRELKKTERSMLPPEMMAPTRFPWNRLSLRMAASTNAPDI
jgi:hypothetical protein